MTTGRGHTGRLLLGAHVTEGPHNIVAKYFPKARANLSRLPPLEQSLANNRLQVSHTPHTTFKYMRHSPLCTRAPRLTQAGKHKRSIVTATRCAMLPVHHGMWQDVCICNMPL